MRLLPFIAKSIHPLVGPPLPGCVGIRQFHCRWHPRSCIEIVTTIITKLLPFTFFILPKPSRDDKFVEKNASIGLCSRRDSWVMVPKRLGLKKRVGERKGIQGKNPQRRCNQHPHGLRSEFLLNIIVISNFTGYIFILVVAHDSFRANVTLDVVLLA